MVIRYLLVSEHSEQEIHKDKCLAIHIYLHTFISQTRFMGIQNVMAELYNACFLTYS